MLVVISFFILTFSGGVFSGREPPGCGTTEIYCSKNEHYTKNDPTCLRTCANRHVPKAKDCKPFTGCVCDDDLVRLYDNATGPCIPEKKCPNKCKDPNAVYKKCPNPCPSTCDEPDTRPCPKICLKYGCECAPGYILSEIGGKCIRPKDCPARCPKNEHYVKNDVSCLKTCGNRLLPGKDTAGACKPFTGCACNDGYVRKYDNATGPCIRATSCPPIPKCGVNEVPTSCRIICPPQSCDSIFTSYYCLPSECEPGCDCRDNYLRNSEGVCILSDDCFKNANLGCNGDPNAVHQDCPSSCPPTCANPIINRACIDACLPGNCVCKPGFILTEIGGKCVKPEECPGHLGCNGDRNATFKECLSACPLTCADQDANKPCLAICLPSGCECNPGYVLTDIGGKCIKPEDCPAALNCTAGCNCIDGYLRNSSGVCIPSEECFKGNGCKGDLNATHVECGSACPATCAEPDSGRPCIDVCVLNACQCNPGYLLSELDGVCIAPGDCPGGSPICGANQTYTYCKVNCPSNYCPVDDSRAQVACSAPYPCPGGCVCQTGYLLVSRVDERCILGSECPPVKCTRPNEVWLPNPSNCFLERCEDRGIICDFPYPAPPRCVCKKGYYRNESDICVPESECPDLGCNGDPNAVPKDCPSSCPPTCANQNINRAAACIDVCLPGGCVCKPGFILTEIGGRCVRPEQCPGQLGCNGDRNATFKECLSACPLTCADQDAGKPCPAICLPSGCECNPGYVLTEIGGKCIKPEDCPGPLGCNGDRNATFKECLSACPLTCADQDAGKPCPAICLPSGCECNPGYVLTEKGGKCIKPEDCPAEPQCNGDRNATFKVCPSACQATCDKPDTDGPCIEICMPDGCVCKQGYLLTKISGKCIKPGDCPGGSPTCGVNETYVYCKVGCPTNYCPVDDSLAVVACDPIYPCPGGCACKSGYLMLSYEDNRCILASECPPVSCTRPNEVWDPNPNNCLRERCDDRGIPCDFPFPIPPRCVCQKGYFRNENDICVPESECPRAGCLGYPNTQLTPCISPCPATCCEPEAKRPCDPCYQPGCECIYGYILSEPNGKCILPSECPGGSPVCPCNTTYTNVKLDCPIKYCPTDMDGTEIITICDPVFPATGCKCNDGYLWLNDNNPEKTCVLASDCPPIECTRPNEVWHPSPKQCWRTLEKCEYKDEPCDDPSPGRPRCVCIDGYYRDVNGDCVPVADCPPPAPEQECTEPNEEWDSGSSQCVCKEGYARNQNGVCIPKDKPNQECGYNEVAVPCRTICPPQNCEIAYTDYYCTEESKKCEPGCDCLPNHLRNGSGICILNEDCPYPTYPICGINEIARDCKRICPPQTCDSKYRLYRCREDIPCEPGCNCVDNYLRDANGICIPSEECPPLCSVPEECKRTCAAPNPPGCPYSPSDTNIDGCNCKEGYILSKLGGKCIKIEDCPRGCNGDSHAWTKRCPLPCPSTCQAPNAVNCKRMCDPIACECESGYLLSNSTGKCILPEKCPGGNPCGKNSVFVDCRVNCPHNYCPENDSRDIVLCDPPNPCLPGCVCNLNHKRKSRKDPRCIVSSSCPPVVCTRPNEVWDSCPSACLAEKCEDVNHQPTVCNTLVLNCEPACICKKDYFRNATDICIPARHCPCPVPDKCKRTCAAPNPQGCSYKPPNVNVDGCDCKEGYILSKLGGKCIKIEDCPRNLGCNGDPHAITKRCPQPCPSTCSAPNAVHCLMMCDPIGCECEPGYLLSNVTGKCILPNKCPGGNPCGKNEHFVPCKVNCPRDYCPVDDSRAVVICDPPHSCLSGCICNLNHKRKSREDPRCIVSSDCPPVKCTRPNEKWSSCPSACLAENCEDVNHQPTVCNTLVLNCEPACICKKDYFRNATDICIPARDCPCPVPDKCKRTCAAPNPPDCPYSPPNVNVDGCDCKEGYILSKLGGKCIKIEDCPRNVGCNGDPHAITKRCPHPCPSTCSSPDALPCRRACEPIACECEPGYLLSNVTGKCILPDQCPGGNPCGLNANFVECKVNCPRDYCPVDDSRDIVLCDPPHPCLSGCVCNFNHKRKSREDPRCIVASDCPPVICTRPNEIWNSCPSDCLAEDCDDVNHEPMFCPLWIHCEPACICKKDYLRNATGICIPNKDCPCPIPNKCKRTCAAPNPPGCPFTRPSVNIDGCTCKEGYILSKLGGKCIKIEDCPRNLGCNGDPHAITKVCPHPCPSTCDRPDAIPCERICDPIGCECEPGYLLSNVTGKCILPDNCPGGDPCGKNEHFVTCKVKCPRDYCPVDDSRDIVVCDPPHPCLSGCACNINYKRKSREDPRCIVASDCPPVVCTRPNEKWSSCPYCLDEDCEDVNHGPTMCALWVNCDPACICKDDYLRNSTGICIPNRDCPCPIPNKCKRTCAAPNPPGCPYSPPSVNIDGCTCKEGYILNKLGGKCIKIEDCPRNLGCNGDPHAITKTCPQPCPSTCDAPNAIPCRRMCDPIGCECEPGYLLSNVTGKCILPNNCPGGNPCGKNEHFVPCKVNCPRDYCPVDDSRAVVTCDPPNPCLSGCICNLNHKRKSREDRRCIVSSDCPPVKCTRPNEKWDSCPSACLGENCEDVNHQPTVCNPLVLNCEPACICKKDFFRNATDICIPARDCPCPVPDKCKRTCAAPSHPDCPYKPPNVNVDGCDCKEGYILSKLGGKCIKIEDCPNNLGCNGDPNAIVKRCPLPCPSTCKSPDATPCKKACEPVGCECKPGYLLSNVTGKCILPDKCPGGNPCGKNAHFVDCKVNGPRDYCPEDDRRDTPRSLTPPRCLPGCICNLNHKRKSQKYPKCIVSSDCPPVICTRPNEVWDSCPSACLAENCEDVHNQPTVCNTLVLNCEPACICKKDYFRNATDICIPAEDCPC